MATTFTPVKAKDLKRGDVLYPSGATITRNRACEVHKNGRFLDYREHGRTYYDCFADDYCFVTKETTR